MVRLGFNNSNNNNSNPLYCIQVDHDKFERCYNEESIMLVCDRNKKCYRKHPHGLIWSCHELGVRMRPWSIEAAIGFRKFIGCTKQIFVSCDASSHQQLGYASEFAKDLKEKQLYFKKLLRHRIIIENMCNDFEFITPKQ